MRRTTVLRRAIALGLLALLAGGTLLSARQDRLPNLILVVAIDQMRADYLTRFDDLFKGGFRTLVDNGAVFTNARYRHASTETAPGHSVILSGRHPSSSGIVGNEWYDPLLGQLVLAIDDPFVDLVGASGFGASPINFVGFTLGDLVKRASPTSRVVGVSLKDRAAILMAGRSADGAFWYDTNSGQFITSTWYMDQLPRWLRNWNGRHAADRYFGAEWTRLVDDNSLYERYAGPDDIEGEWDRQDTVFPHLIRGDAGDPVFYGDLRRTPFVDRLVYEVALEALDAYDLGDDDAIDIFAVSFSATDYVGHTYGPDSQEMMDQLLRLDLLLGDFLDEIDRRVGLDRTLVVLTSDHGVMPLVEVAQAQGVDARRIDPRELFARVVDDLSGDYDDPAQLFASFGTDGVTFNRSEISARGLSLPDLERRVARVLESADDVAAVYRRAELAGNGASDDPYLPLYRNAFFPSRSPDLTIRLQPNLYPSSEYLGGTGHGTPYDYDRRVPMIFMGRGIPAAAFEAESGPEDIAPTLGALLGWSLPTEPDARVLREIISVP